MFAPLLLIALSALGQTPNDSFATALADLRANVPAESRHYTRYVSLVAVPDAARPDYVKVFTYAINATSFRATLARPVVLTDPAGVPILLRLDLRAMEWDKGSRSVRLAELERRGVDFKLKDARARAEFLDPWELFAREDPYHFTNTIKGDKVTRGWIDPDLELNARLESVSGKFVLRADWLLSRLLVEKDFKGYYSTLLMLPPVESDLLKVFLVDIKAVERDSKLRRGGAVLESIVALNNRELQLIPGSYGIPISFIWRTFDVNVDARGNKSVLEALAGTLEHDGREIIGTLPNSLHWYYLADGKGNQVAVVPENIAQIKAPLVPPKDTRVVNSVKCIECHREGIIRFDDVVSKAILNPDIALAVSGGDKNKVASLRSALEDYYQSPLDTSIRLQQDIWQARVKEACGMNGTQLATNLIGYTEAYVYDLVTPEAAAREVGLPLPQAIGYWRTAVDDRYYRETGRYRPNPILAVLSGGQPIKRVPWEQSYGDSQRARIHPWEVPPVVVPVAPVQLKIQPRR